MDEGEDEDFEMPETNTKSNDESLIPVKTGS